MDLLESFGMQAIESAIQTDLNNERNSCTEILLKQNKTSRDM